MCLASDKIKDEDVIITVKDKTTLMKYEFLKLYYTKWNDVIKQTYRFIVDTHAGSGIVNYIPSGTLFQEDQIKQIYGSPLIALLKTIRLSDKLTLIFNEVNEKRFIFLNEQIENVKQNGIRLFRKDRTIRYHKIDSQRTKKMESFEYRYPDELNEKIPPGFQEIYSKTKANLILYNDEIENKMCHRNIRMGK